MKLKVVLFFFMFFLGLPGPVIAGLLGPKDEPPPVITMQTDTPQIIFMAEMVLEGQVEGKNKITSLMINQTPLLNPKGTPVFFSHMVELDPGENILTIEAVDEAGKSAAKTLYITRKPASQIQLSERLSLAVLPFRNENAGKNTVPGFQDSLTHALTKRNRFRMIERNQIELILQEQNLNRTGLFDAKTAVKIGRMASARSVLTGSIMNIHNRTVITARMIDVETSKVVSTRKICGKLNNISAAGDLAEKLAIKFHQDFPLLDGHIIEKQGENIIVDKGQNMVKPGRRLIIFRGEPMIHPLTGKRLGMDIHILGHARVTKVLPETAVARLVDGDKKTVGPSDRFITE